MLKKFSATNVGCFPTVSIELDPLTVLVGPNASGKSTILRAIRTLAILMRLPLYSRGDVELSLGSIVNLRDLLLDDTKEATLSVDAESGEGRGSYTIGFGLEPGTGRIEISSEAASWDSRSGDDFQYDSTNKRTRLEFDFRGVRISTDVPRSASLPFLAREHWLREPKWRRALKGLYDLVACFSPFHVYRFSPGAIAQPAEPTAPVSYDGAGLAAELDRLLGSNRAVFDAMVTDLKTTFPHVQNVNIRTIKTRGGSRGGVALKLLEFELTNGRKIPAGLESDGVLLTLAYLWLARQQDDTAFGVEEPETAGYPTIVKEKVRLLKALTDGKTGRRPVQIIATSHSPVLLIALGDTSHIRVCERGAKVYAPPERSMMDVIHTRLAWAVEG